MQCQMGSSFRQGRAIRQVLSKMNMKYFNLVGDLIIPYRTL